MMVDQLDIYINEEPQSKSYNLYKNCFKMDHASKYYTNYRRKQRIFS